LGATDAGRGKAVARLVGESYAVAGTSPSRWSAQLAAATAQLPPVAARRLYHSADGSRYYTENELTALPAAARAALVVETVDEEGYYYGPLGSPLFYMRLLDIVSENLRANLPGRRLLELSYSSIGPLKLLALQGVQAVGISSSARLRALYSFPGDQGDVPVVDRDVKGRLTLLGGAFPAEPTARAAVGGDYDVILVRNLLTRGYVHPSAESGSPTDRPVALGARVDLGVTDEEFLRSVLAALKPGGRLLSYNLCPPPPPAAAAYDPHSDCRNPFPQALWQAMGFRVRDYDRSDTPAARALAQALGPVALTTPLPAGAGAGQLLPGELYATYTLVERP
jgi:SAM-dependent methyltransferase